MKKSFHKIITLESSVAISLNNCRTCTGASRALRSVLVTYSPPRYDVRENWATLVPQVVAILSAVFEQWSVHGNDELLKLVHYLAAPLLSRSTKIAHYQGDIGYGVLIAIFTAQRNLRTHPQAAFDASADDLLRLVGDLVIAQMNRTSYPFDTSTNRIWYAAYDNGTYRSKNSELCNRTLDFWMQKPYLSEVDFEKTAYLLHRMLDEKRGIEQPLAEQSVKESGFPLLVLRRLQRKYLERNGENWEDILRLTRVS